MGAVMKDHKESHAALIFKRRDGTYRGSIPISDLSLLNNDPAETMRAVTDIYRRALSEIRQWQLEAKSIRQSKMPLPARKAWELGDIVHRLETDLARHSCKLENVYDHLTRHAKTPGSGWLGTFVTFRRYVDDKGAIPENLNWNSVAKKAGSVGQAITIGRFTES